MLSVKVQDEGFELGGGEVFPVVGESLLLVEVSLWFSGMSTCR